MRALLPNLFTVALLVAACAPREASAQYFGKNKVEYVDLGFGVLESKHFDIYHYPAEAAAAQLAARLAERWYARFARLLHHDLTGRQPLILYGSHPEFSQTNIVPGLVGEGIGGVTDFARRRVAMPFAPTLAETDHVLGHEIAHAFQFDVLKRHGGSAGMTTWAIEGMAQYLSLGASDHETAMWLRDAVAHDLLPATAQAAARRFSPYRYGHAWWTYLARRFGDRVLRDVLEAGRARNFDARLLRATGVGLDDLFAGWRDDARRRAGTQARTPGAADSAPRTAPGTARRDADERQGRVRLGPALSPDGRRVAFFSERDRLSLDLYVADRGGGRVRKLATTVARDGLESLQPIRSAGAWSPDGARFVFAAVHGGRPALVVFDMRALRQERVIALDTIGEVFTPSWSPDGRAIVFAGLSGGLTDLHVYALDTSTVRRLTDDAVADLHPAWSPDGSRIVFATERFSSDLDTLRFGPPGLAILEVATGAVQPLRAFDGARHVNPQWSPDGQQVYFLSDPDGISNVYRLDLASRQVFRVTQVGGGVAGLAATSPALSVARDAHVVAFSVYRSGRFAIETVEGPLATAGTLVTAPATTTAATTALMGNAAASTVTEVLGDASFGLPPAATANARPYDASLSLEGIGQPYLSSGGGPLGSFVRAGGALLFGDLLGERKLAAYVQVGSRARDLALRLQYLNRERRWNWGGLAEVEPSIRQYPRRRIGGADAERTLEQEVEYLQQTQLRVAGVLAYPFSRARRIELSAGVRHARYRADTRARVRSLETGRVLSDTFVASPGGEPATVGEVSAALVGDTAVIGPTGPILGSRYRFELTPTQGDLSFTRVLLDYRRYLMPVKPYTIAARLLHSGRYGPDSTDPRLAPTFLGSQYFVRGYGWSALRCQWDASGECGALDELLGRRLVVGNVEVRAPLAGMFARELRYGPVPVETFAFADAGVLWSRGTSVVAPGERLVRSVGAGFRANALGFPLEIALVRSLDAPARGWSWVVGFRPAF